MASKYTYQDFQSQLNASGLAGNFSQYDLDMAKQNPDFGISMLGLKQSYLNAQTDEERQKFNDQANQLRTAYGGYSGGGDGSQYILTSPLPSQMNNVTDQISDYGSFSFDQAAPAYEDQYSQYQQQILDSLLNQGSFSFDQAAPTYENQYGQYQQQLLDSILNREDFSWSKENDPQWASYKKEYLREGERAGANALAQASAASGGRASSYAVNAASQAGDYYAAKLADAIPTLYQQAYEKYLNEYNMKLSDLSAVNTQEQIDYGKYLDALGQYNTDRNFAYSAWQGETNRLLSQLGAVNGQEQIDYGKYLDALNQYNTDRNFAYNQYLGDFGVLQGQLSSLSNQNELERNWYLELLNREYQKEQDQKAWDYQTGRDSIADARYEDETAYNRDQAQMAWDYQTGRDSIADARYEDETAYNRGQVQYSKDLDAALTLAGQGLYSNLAQLWGLDEATTQALVDKYAKEQALSDQQAAIELAEIFAGYGDNSGLAGLGMDTGYQDAVNANNLKILQGQAAAYGANTSGGSYSAGGSSRSGGAGYNNGNCTAGQIKAMQEQLGVTADGYWGPKTQAAALKAGLSNNADEAWAVMSKSGTSGGGDDEYENAAVDTASVLALGYGPISADILAELEAQGEIISYVSGGKIIFKKVKELPVPGSLSLMP